MNSTIGLFFRRFFKTLIEDESGQAFTEYILILATATVVASALCKKLLDVMDSGILRFGGALEKDLKTGRAPLGAWSN